MSGAERPGEPDGPADAEAEAVWNDLVAAFHEAAPADGPVPWPEAENVPQPPPPAPGPLEPGARVVRPAARPAPPRPVDSQLTWTSGAIGPRDVPPPAEPEQPESFEPPTPEPLPSLDWPARAAWLGALGGPGYLMAATILNWQTPTVIAVGCALAGLCGFGYLVSRLKPHRDDDDDDNFGAVV